jgi:hypothetical protein
LSSTCFIAEVFMDNGWYAEHKTSRRFLFHIAYSTIVP